jgi:hypothetical protein
MDQICDPALVESTFKSSHSMQLRSNGGTMEVRKQAIMPGYHMHMWYNKKAITNILSLSNVIKQYQVTYDSNDQMFVVHRDSEGKLDMEFWMHKSRLHYFDPRDSKFTFVIIVSKNKAGFTKRQIKDAEVARSLYSKLNYPSWKDFKWIIRSNQIKDCPVTVGHVDTALNIWGKNVAVLKGKTTQTKPDPVAKKVPMAIEAPQRGVYHCQPFLCKQDSILPSIMSQDMFYGNQSPCGQNCSANIHGVQGDLLVLSSMWLPHYNGTCRWGIRTPQGSD